MSNGDGADISLDQLRRSLAVLARQKTFIGVFCLSASLTALALTYVASEKYEAAAAIFYQPQEVSQVHLTDFQSFGGAAPAPPFNVIIVTLRDLIRSEAILEPVVLEIGLHLEAEPEDGPWYVWLYRTLKDFALDTVRKGWMLAKHGRIIEEDPVAAAVKRLRANVQVVSKESYAFAIIVRDKGPIRAAMTVDALGARLVDFLRQQDRQPGEDKREQLAELVAQKRREIEQYSGAIEDLLVTNDIASVSVETQRGMARWSELEVERVKLESQLKEKRLELDILNQKLDETNGAYLRPDDYKELASSRTFAEVDLEGLEARYDVVLESTRELRSRLNDLPVLQTEVDRLNVRLEAAKRDFVLLSDAYQEAQVRATDLLSEAKVLHKATVPAVPVAPIKVYHVGLALFLSLAVGIGLVYLLSFFGVGLLFTPEPPEGQASGAEARA